MKIVRFLEQGEACYGVLEGEMIRPLESSPYKGVRFAARAAVPVNGSHLLTPVEPTKILAVGLNYRDHALEMGEALPTEPTIFMKPLSCLVGDGDTVRLPSILTRRVDHEAELVAVMGRRAQNISEAEARDYILGYTCGNDVSARDIQQQGKQWDFCKGADTFGPVGPWIETELDAGNLDIRMRVNGELRQHSNTNQLVFSVPFLVSFLSRWMTLEAGDIIFTGTPSGVGPLSHGDVMEVDIQGLGILRNPVVQG